MTEYTRAAGAAIAVGVEMMAKEVLKIHGPLVSPDPRPIRLLVEQTERGHSYRFQCMVNDEWVEVGQ